MNSCNFVGNLTEDVKLTTVNCADGTTKSKAIIKLAVNGKGDKPLFIDIATWGKLAENCSKYLKKGSPAAINAEVENNDYEKDGNKIYTYQFTAKTVDFISAGKKANADADE